ncbi:hypothetical protein BT96DRAFT_996926 [Gymnopus androsaceus JB14]|uniref:DNA breaking-rejoining enzyme n=1 Tax=Gymnopus androsaceus JB14 TaxID=1447944 RepID=A0A6A4HET2_9AGAR|nr:hypothetical protein BT96DRAFT_996926 [Gymnopus androsaceus JB14]
MQALCWSLDLFNAFDACVWAACCCAFWGLMRFGEVTVRSRADFSPNTHLTWGNAHLLTDEKGSPYIHLDLPHAKAADPGKGQSVYISTGGDLCAQAALANLAKVVPGKRDNPLFSWRDNHGSIHPLTWSSALARINSILSSLGWGNAFGHSFRIGCASYLLSQGVSLEIVCIAGRWCSLAYEV